MELERKTQTPAQKAESRKGESRKNAVLFSVQGLKSSEARPIRRAFNKGLSKVNFHSWLTGAFVC